MSNRHTLTKTCSHCGEQKPISAFLHMADAQGAIYGNICSSCRSILMGDKAGAKDDERTRSDTRAAIDAKAKVQSEVDKRKQRQDQKTLDATAKQKEEAKRSIKTELTQKIESGEKKQRVQSGRTSFLDSTNIAKLTSTTHATDSSNTIREKTTTDLTKTFQGFSQGLKAEHKTATFLQFMAKLGLSAPIAATMASTKHKTTAAAKTGQPGEKQTSSADEKKEKRSSLFKELKSFVEKESNASAVENPAEDFANKTWGPRPKK